MRISARFTGPPTSANGGVAAGMLAERVGSAPDAGAVEVTLRRPPPLEVDLTVTDGSLYDGDLLLAEARHVGPDLEPPPPVTLAEAVGLADVPGHAFPTCFVCGTERPDGLRLFAGPIADGQVATTWTPTPVDGLSPTALVWAALDCPGGFAVDLPHQPMLLGRFTLRLDALPKVGDLHVVQGWHVRTEGRKVLTGSALTDADGRVLAVAAAVWIRPRP